VLSGGAWAWTSLSLEVLLAAGLWAVAVGLGLGLPTGLVYHLALRRSLAAEGRLPPRWWLRPIALHPLLPDRDHAHVLFWCRVAGGFGGIAFLGCAIFALAAARLVAETP
jgi:hypothetical protein